MSRMNRIRIINLNYNYNSIRIDDELFDLAGESTLFSLRNGGGKSVLVQMLTAPFVSKRYRSTSERPFSSYFTTNQPTFILVEWALDNGAGYVLTGMMVRKNQEVQEDENPQELEIINFIHEYKTENDVDIMHIPFIVQQEQQKQLKGFHQCKQLFEKWKQDSKLRFNYYDMNNSAKSRAYFTHLQEFKIYPKEWESIIKKVNLKESGLSELFKEAKEEKGLVEKWFLSTIEDKINKEKNRMKEFESILYKYIFQYKDNQVKYEKKDRIIQFMDQTQDWFQLEEQLKLNQDQIADYQTQIAVMLATLNVLIEENQQGQDEIKEQRLQFEEEIKQIQYEEQSLEIYEIEDELDQLQTGYEYEEELFEKLKAKLEATQKESHCLEAARLFLNCQEASEDVQEYENQLEVAQISTEQLKPRKESLGYTLRLNYEETVKKLSQELSQTETRINELIEQGNEHRQQYQKQHEQLVKLNREESQLGTRIEFFGEIEKSFNQQFQKNYYRNLEGHYEAGFLDREEHQLQETISQVEKKKRELKSSEIELEEQNRSFSRTLQDYQQQSGALKIKLETAETELSHLEEQIATRKGLLPYVSWPEGKLFETEGIIQAFATKINQNQQQLHQLQRQLEEFELEYEKLKSGTVMELPEEFESILNEEGIQFIMGMEWLRRNQKTFKQNQQLVEQNPFIPYSIILTQADFGRLKESHLDFFTSFPIPIVIREEIESSKGGAHGFVTYENLHFYVLFNGNLLDEIHLNQVLQEKEQQIQKQNELVAQKTEEINLYREKEGMIKYQTVTEVLYKRSQKKIQELSHETQNLEDKVFALRQQKETCEKQMEDINSHLAALDPQLLKLNNQKAALQGLKQKYENYLQALTTKATLEKEIFKTKKAIDFHQSEEVRLDEDRRTQEGLRHDWTNQLKMEKNELAQYQTYQEGVFIKKDIEDLRAEYKAIVEQLGGDIKRIQQELKKANERYARESEYLTNYLNHYQLVDKDYLQVNYADYKKDHILRNIEAYKEDINKKQSQLHELKTEMAVLKEKRDLKRKILFETFNTSEILPKHKVVKRNYKEEIAMIQQKDVMLQVQEKHLITKNKILSDNKNVLGIYEDFSLPPNWELDEKYRGYSRDDWHQARGNLVRDYRSEKSQTTTLHHQIEEVCGFLLREEAFQEEFFSHPLQNLYRLRFSPRGFMSHYETVTESFKNLLGKLEVDISTIEKEKANVLNLLLDYVQEIHQNLGKIDQNSSIQVRGKSLKMLRIILPNWEEHQGDYYHRLEEFMLNLTQSCLELLEENQNIEELIGRQITTKQLYDTVVGTSNVGIRLYKIEEQRELAISWEQVAKNSGGEGFLSAFVILSSLLSFMRRDDTDIFSTQEEGKVLLMDNPFAQTNAAHLLKPLMELAKKNNTQLLCLSGLGGDSIYSRFENIYSLSLVRSNLKKDLNYLKSEHVKGELNQEVMVPTRIYVQEEQMSLLF